MLFSGVGSSAVMLRTGVLKPLAVSLTVNDIELLDQRAIDVMMVPAERITITCNFQNQSK